MEKFSIDPTPKEPIQAPTNEANLSNENNEFNDVEKIIDFRIKQSYHSRLAEYITGLRPDDPKMPERLEEDQKIIRAKYHLPPRGVMFDTPSEYEHFLLDLVKKYKVDLRSTSERELFFKKFPSAIGVYNEIENMINMNIKRNEELKDYIKSIGTLEHEMIHAMQHSLDPNMPIELMEYEAYLANVNTKAIAENPEYTESLFFGFFIGRSVNIHYKEKHEKELNDPDMWFKPMWDNPEYFLKNVDKIDLEELEKFKEKYLKEN